MSDPEQHPAYVAFMARWDEPVDASNGSRAGLDDKEMGIVYGAQQFVNANPPPRVLDALVRWLRPQLKTRGAWDYAGQALRVVCDTAAEPAVVTLEQMLESPECSRASVVRHLRVHAEAPIEVRDALRSALWGSTDRFAIDFDDLWSYVEGELTLRDD